MTNPAIATLERGLRGRLIRPTDSEYDAVRALYNGMIDKRPRLIARCVDVADVIISLNFAREEGLLLAIVAADTTVLGSAAATTDWSSMCR